MLRFFSNICDDDMMISFSLSSVSLSGSVDLLYLSPSAAPQSVSLWQQRQRDRQSIIIYIDNLSISHKINYLSEVLSRNFY